MKPTLIIIGVPIVIGFGAAAFVFAKEKSVPSFVQVLGAGFLLVVVVEHVFEALNMFPRMGWGFPHSLGHYVDLISAAGGLILFPAGYLLRRFSKRRISN